MEKKLALSLITHHIQNKIPDLSGKNETVKLFFKSSNVILNESRKGRLS